MKRQLFVCNSVYQIFVALWIKFYYYSDSKLDIIISDHMSQGKKLADNIRQISLFEHVYYAETLDFAKFNVKLTKKERIFASLYPNKMLHQFVDLSERYTQLYIANVDYFSQLLFDALAHKNAEIELIIYEDGMFTYSRLYEKDYLSTFIPKTNVIKKFLHTCIYRKKTIFGNVHEMLVFNPENMLWKPDFPIVALKKIERENREFRGICNLVFSYYNSTDVYDKKYIFLEESFSAEGAKLDDLEIVEQIALRVGKENIMVKIHPRNPINRFARIGIKTNQDISIPWEVIIMNTDFSDKILITVSSSSILNPRLIFGQYVKAYSIYECVDHEHCNSRLLSDDMWEIASKLFKKYKDMVTICNTIDEIE